MPAVAESRSWDFRGQNTSEYSHGIHPYPGRMPPQLPRMLIARYKPRKGCIGDPFCGSGTVLLESMLSRRSAHGSDLNGLAVLISRVKTTSMYYALRKETLSASESIVKRARDSVEHRPDENETIGSWYPADTSQGLRALRSTLVDKHEKIPSSAFDLLTLALAFTARRTSYQRWNEFKSYRIPAEKRKEYAADPFDVFSKRVEIIIESLVELYKQKETLGIGRETHIEAVVGDARSFSPDCEVGLVVSSPPYGDAATTVAYDQFSFLAGLWLREMGIECSPKPNRDEKHPSKDVSNTLESCIESVDKIDAQRGRQIRRFYDDMYSSLTQIDRILLPNGRVCFVVGGRTVKGVKVPMKSIIDEMALSLGFEIEASFERVITSKTQPPRNSLSDMINNEAVEVYKKP